MNQHGFTLVELLITLAILSIITSASAYSFRHSLQNARVESEVQRLAHLLKLTRSEAVTRQTNAALCPLLDDGKCSRDWQLPLSVFLDHNGNGKLDSSDKIVRQVEGVSRQLRVKWRSPSKRIQYNLTGNIRGSLGSLDICTAQDEHHLSRALIVSLSGRVRVSQDRDQSGIHESGNGRDIQCG